jgi:amino acid transporter/nucleotide-binding universal stress UspA family protein
MSASKAAESEQPAPDRKRQAAKIIVVSSVMFTFIGYWRAAAVVLCDMSSTVYYIGAIVESAIGKCAPWFILAVLLFSYAMRAVYIESSALFVRGGVYRVVKEAMGGLLAKVSVSALLFDYVLTGPISGVSAGQYIVGLALEAIARFSHVELDEGTKQSLKAWGSVAIACTITLYFLRQNLLGIPESSGKALKIMIATTIMGVVVLTWSLVTLASRGPVNPLPSWKPDLSTKVEMNELGQAAPKINPLTGEQEDPLGFIPKLAPSLAQQLRSPTNWFSAIGVLGLIIAFGHSILAMSGEETLAQVYREVESPKLPNFKKAAFIVFFYSFALTGTMNVIALLLIPDDLRMKEYYDNWMGGLAMQLLGPVSLRLVLNAFVVIVGFLILAGAVNTSIIGSNGVLSRVAEDGVLPSWFLKPHGRFGTTSRILWLITGLQLFTIVISRGNVILLGEAYAFGVVWSFVFKTLSMVILRFKDRTKREFSVPFNFRIGEVQVPLGLSIVFLIVFVSALANFFTKPVATVSGLLFSAAFLAVFVTTERLYERRRRGAKHEHLEQFNQQLTHTITPQSLGISKPYRKLIAIRSPQNLFMLEKALAETDPDTTDVVVMTAKVFPRGAGALEASSAQTLDIYDLQLLTAVVERAERAGKNVKPLVLQTNSPLDAVLRTAKAIGAQEVVIGASNKFTAEEQLDQLGFYWINLHDGQAAGLTVRILSRSRDVTFDLAGGNRIPRLGEQRAHSVADLREAGVGIDRVLFVHSGTPACSDLFHGVLTMLDPQVVLDIADVPLGELSGLTRRQAIEQNRSLAQRIGRRVQVHALADDCGEQLVRIARDGGYDVIVIPAMPEQSTTLQALEPPWLDYVLKRAPCPVLVRFCAPLPCEVEK